MAEWLPIETAPKDGTPILVVGGAHTAAEIRAADGAWWNHCPLKGVTPTHWMPLPDPPEANQSVAPTADA